MATLIPQYDLKDGTLIPSGAVNRPINKKLQETISIKDFGAVCDGVTDDTVAVQNAINFAENTSKAVLFEGTTVLVGSLSLPSNTILELGTTTLKLKNATNLPLLINSSINYTAGTYGNTNIQINNGTLDFNGANQSDTNPSTGAVAIGVKFVGVNGLTFNQTTFINSRRYNIFICNCSRIRAYGTEIINNPTIAAVNRDGWHINGKTDDFYADVIRISYSQDDAVAINADDVNTGGDMSTANISGPISNIRIGTIHCIDSSNALRLLSANYKISDVNIGSITGQLAEYAVNVSDYGLGTASWYQNINIGNINVDFLPSGYGGTLSLVNIVTNETRNGVQNNISIGSITRNQADDAGQQRGTVLYTPKRTTLKIGLISEFNCSNTQTVYLVGAKAGTTLEVESFERSSSRVDSITGNYGIPVYVDSNVSATIDSIKIGQISWDYMRNGVVVANASVRELEYNTSSIATYAIPGLDRQILTAANSVIFRLFWQSTEPNSYLNSTYRYVIGVGCSVEMERPAPLSGATATRPINALVGDRFYDTTTATSLVWNGTAWV
jgi:hypothetical protein